jgi:phage-related protein
MLDNTAGAIEQLTGALESAGIIIGQQLTPYIRQLAEWITGLVERFNSLSEEQQEQITKWGLILASIGPILLIVSKLIGIVMSLVGVITNINGGISLFIQAIGLARKGMGETALEVSKLYKVFMNIPQILKTIIGAINPVIVIIGVLVGAIITLWNTNEEFRNKVIEIWNNLQTSIGDFVSGIKQILDDLGLNFEEIKEAILFTWNALCDSLSPLITGAMDIAVKVIDGALDTILGIFKVFAKLFKGDWRGALDAVEDIIDGWIETIIGVFSSMFETIGGFFKKILGGIQDVVDKGNKAKGITRGGMYADGSHADGLPYVPYDGYIAELHEGERVLTKQQNNDYNKGTGTGGDTYNFYNTQPNPYEYARQMKKAKRELLQGV